MGTSKNGTLNNPSNMIRFNQSSATIRPATILAKTRSGEVIGKLQYSHLKFSFVGKGLDEISFEVHKKTGRNTCKFWDKLHGLLIIDYVGYGQFEAEFTTNINNESIKNCTAVSLETELGQLILHSEAHYNDEQGMENAIKSSSSIDKDSSGNYIPLMLCNKENQDHSVLHRILKDKAPHWSIGHIPDYMVINDTVYKPDGLQRSFNFEGKSIYAALQSICEECNCIFTFDTYNRLIELWNLEECVFDRNTMQVVEGAYYLDGKYYAKDGTTLSGDYGFADGIGNDTHVIVSQKQLATDFTINEDKDSVKNCFYVKGGDDLMTNMVAAANVTGDNDIIMFSELQKEDMPNELVTAIQNYQNDLQSSSDKFYKVGGYFVYDETCTYDQKTKTCRNKNNKILTDAFYNQSKNKVYVLDNYVHTGTYNGLSGCVLDRYDNLILNDDYIYIANAGLYVRRCQIADRLDWLQNSKFPNTDPENTTAKIQFDRIVNRYNGSHILYENGQYSGEQIIITNSCTSESYNHVISTARSVFNIIADYRYEVEILSGDQYPSSCTILNDNNLTGTLKCWVQVTNASQETDTYTGEVTAKLAYVSYKKVDQSKEYLEQKFYINLSKTDIFGIDYYDLSDAQFTELLHQYNYNSLCTYTKAFNSCVNVLDDVYPKSDKVAQVVSETYNTMRAKYEHFASLIDPVRLETLHSIEELQSDFKKLDDEIIEFRKGLSIREYLGEDNYKLFRSYIREDEYTNSNYISDGLNTYQILDKAKELLDVARKELKKACVLQRTVSSNITNIYALPQYRSLFSDFAIFNYIRAKIDDEIYKLRIVQIDFDEDSLNQLSVKFSDNVEYTDGSISDLQSMKDSVSDISTSYNVTTLQAKQGASAMSQFDRLYQDGISSADFVLKNSDDEEVTMDRDGILCKSMNDIGEYGAHQCRLIGNGLYLTNDRFKTPPKAAIGLMKVNDQWQYGVLADVLIGKMIVGESLAISNSSGSVQITGDGIRLSKGTVIDWSEVDAPQINEISGLFDKLNQLDNRIETFSQDTDPSTNWNNTEKANHNDDIWYDTKNSLTKQWDGSKWNVITDSQLEALAKSKAQIFTFTDNQHGFPSNYNVGDMWILQFENANGEAEVYVEITELGKVEKKYPKAKKGTIFTAINNSAQYNVSDWIEKVRYTDDTKANEVDTALTAYKKEITEFQTTVNTQFEVAGVTKIGTNYVYAPKIGGGYLYISKSGGCSVEIDPLGVRTSNSKKVFSIANSNGDYIFKVDNNGNSEFAGKITATSGSIGGWGITSSSFIHTNSSEDYLQLSSSSLSMITYSKSNDEKTVFGNGRVQFLRGSTTYMSNYVTNWKDTTLNGMNFWSNEDSKYVAFGKNTDSNVSSYNPTLVLNYGLDPNGYKQDVLIYGTTRLNNKLYFNGDFYLSGHNTDDINDGVNCNGRFHSQTALSVGSTIRAGCALSVMGDAYISGQLSNPYVMNANLGWYPNGVSLYDVSPGVYSTNGGAIPNGLEALSPYGTLLIMKETYITAIYISVVGQMAVWASNSNAWSVIKS